MIVSEIIDELKAIKYRSGDLKVFLQGMDEGGIYPYDYRTSGIEIYDDDEHTEKWFYLTEGTDDTDTISTLIAKLEEFEKENGDEELFIGYGDSGGSYSGNDEISDISLETVDNETCVVIS